MKFQISNFKIGEVSHVHNNLDENGNVISRNDSHWGGFDMGMDIEMTVEEFGHLLTSNLEALKAFGPLMEQIATSICKVKNNIR